MRQFVLILLLFTGYQAMPQWSYVHPDPTPEGVAAVDFPVPGTGIAVCYSGTVLKSDDAGLHWSVVQKQPFGQGYFTDVAFTSSTTGFVISSSGNIYHTTDGGKNWDTSALFSGENLLSIHMVSSYTGYCSGAGGCFLRTVDGGVTWEKIPDVISADLFDCWFTSPETGFIGAGRNVLKTVDGGITWNVVYPLPQGYSARKVLFFNPMTGLVIGRNGGIFRTADGGLNWQQVPVDLKSNLNGLAFNGISTVVITADGGKMLKSDDNGLTWMEISTSFPYNFGPVVFPSATTAVAFGPLGAIWNSGTSGLSWEPSSYVTFNQLNTVDCVDGSLILAAGSAGTIIRTTNGGDDWQLIQTATNLNINDIGMVNDQAGFLAGDQGLLMKTVNGGESWQPLASPAGYDWRCLSFRDQSTGLLSGIGPVIYRTENGGTTWQAISTGVNAAINGVSLNGNSAWACGSGATLLRSANGGRNWNRVLVPELLEANLNRIQCLDENRCMVTGNQYLFNSWTMFLAMTGDGGSSWKVRTFTYSPDKIVTSLFFVDPYTGFIAGNDFIWKTSDGGDSWISQLPSEAPLGPNELVMMNNGTGFAAGYSGQVLKTVNGGGLTAEKQPWINRVVLGQNFPNPVKGTTAIPFTLTGKGRLRLDLFDLQGGLIRKLMEGFMQPGDHHIVVDCRDLLPGLYFYRLTDGGTVETGKMIVK